MPAGITTIKKIFSITVGVLVLTLCAPLARSQGYGAYNERTAQNLIWDSKLQSQVEFWCDSLMQGRATGTKGGVEASFALIGKFGQIGLLPLSGSYSRSFYAKDSTLVGHNVVGLLPGSLKKPVESYIVVMAHFDHIGTLGGVMYPGADSNASGVVALTSLAEMFASMKVLGKAYGSSIVFVGLDGNQLSTAGAYALRDDIVNGRMKDPLTGRHITSDKVKLVVNIDEVGASLSTLRSGREDFIVVLGNQSLPKGCQDMIYACNRVYGLHLEVSETYFGSENFTRLFYSISDQRPFVEDGVPAVMFTSGITMNTNKTWDVPASLNYPVLRRRIYLMYHWLDRMTVYLSY